MLDVGKKALSKIRDVLLFESATLPPNRKIMDKRWRNGISFSELKMAAAAMLDSSYREILDIIDKLQLSNVATLLPNLVEIGRKMSERHPLLEIRDGGSRHVDFRLSGVHRYHRYVAIRRRHIPTKFGGN